jgi:TRAP-type mannitol/chloroaromatic compound transport system substrate-binding protein
MKRREFLKTAAVGAAASAVVAAPAIAQSTPEVRWRMTSSFPKSLDTIYGAGEIFCRTVSELSDGRFTIQHFAAGEIVPGLQALDAVQKGAVEACGTASFYYVGKDPAFAFGTAIPFGLNARQQNAWWHMGGGREIMNAFYAKYDVVGYPLGNTGCQMAGWFRKEINSVEDLSGLKFRIGGLAGHVVRKLGAVPQQIAAGDVYPSLERGTIDAAEWIGPYDDEKLGFNKVAPFYYYPGWWEGGTMTKLLVNKARHDDLPPIYRAIIEAASHRANTLTLGKYDHVNPGAIRRLVAAGVQLRPFSAEIMDACRKASNEVYAEIGATNADFKGLLDHTIAFRDEQYLWSQVAEYSYDSFMIRSRAHN